MLGEVVIKADLPKTRIKGDAMVTTVTGRFHDIQFSVNMMASTRGETETLRMLKPYGSVDLSLYKSFMNDRVSLQFQAKDLFNTSAPDVTMFSGNRTLSAFQESRRSFGITVRYKFNATKSKYKGTGAGESQKSRM